MSDLFQRYNEIEKQIDAENYDEAIPALVALTEEDESFVMAHLALSLVYTKTGQHDLAVQHGEKACELEPNDSFNYTALSVTYQRAWAGTQDQAYITKAEDAMAKAKMIEGR
jgi:Flp pilus assembly protein TadD